MGAGSQLAAERDRWPFRWQVTDLDAEAEALLLATGADESLLVVVPAELASSPISGRPTPRPVLVALTDRRIVVVGVGPGVDPGAAAQPGVLTSAGHRQVAVPVGAASSEGEGPPGPFDLVVGPLTVRIDLDAAAVTRLAHHLVDHDPTADAVRDDGPPAPPDPSALPSPAVSPPAARPGQGGDDAPAG